jgi:hypothetical protein
MVVSGFGPLEMPWQAVSICFAFFPGFRLRFYFLFFGGK